MLSRLIQDSVEIKGADSETHKRDSIIGFADGKIRVIVTKPKIAGFGMNLQNCHRMAFVGLSDSYEALYQATRRCWRFGQEKPVVVDVIASEGQAAVLRNLQRKADAADKMFARLVAHMNDSLTIQRGDLLTEETEVPAWL